MKLTIKSFPEYDDICISLSPVSSMLFDRNTLELYNTKKHVPSTFTRMQMKFKMPFYHLFSAST